MPRDIKSRRLKPGVSSPSGMRLDCVAIEAIAKNQIVYVDSVNAVSGVSSRALGTEVKRRVGVATNATKAKSHTELLIALHAASSGQRVICCPIGVLKNLDTSGAAKGDPVFLGTAGAPTLTATGFQRRIGTVSIVGVSGTGAVSFNPSFVNESARHPIVGTATITNGTGSVTVTAATLGGSFGGAPAFAQFQADDGVLVINAVAWSTNDLVISSSGNTTADRVVAYQIWV